MEPPFLILLGTAVALVAALYGSVGHGGASGYIAVMTLCGLAPAEIKPAALVLNVVVASVAAVQFARAGHFRWALFWPFAVMSVPAAFLGGRLKVDAHLLQQIIGGVLLFSAFRLVLRQRDPENITRPPLAAALMTGAGVGLLSGLTGTGGGIFLTPLLLLCGWARTKEAGAVSALFILLNSAAGLAGHLHSGGSVPYFTWTLCAGALAGGAAGAWLGARRLPVRAVSLLLAAVLVMAGGKLLLL